ncbi:MAG: bifunctional folylpolyglutamate synthase/dihydrofolate synthase [Lachnospiraceae bacterium]|nr:bifunctional folylpolyglutamate synthase/dihydrofolate synthase [Lachnospiraceae bacterium]
MTPAEERAFLEECRSGGSVMDLDAMRLLTEKLGNPEEAVPCVHIAGTNGKGSTLAYLRSILKEAGLKCGYYFSPAVFKEGEQIGVGGRTMGSEKARAYLEEIRKASLEMKAEGSRLPTIFEVQTAQAFCYFREMKADIAVIECGMGGRDDATNVIPAPIVCVFAPISLDHVNILGKDISGIASVKAGIIKPGSRVVSAHQDEAAYKELKKACDKTGSSLTIADEPVNIRFSLREQSFDCGGYKGLKTGLKGVFQPDNAALALAAVKALNEAGIEISEEAVRRGLKEAQWPGRFEIIKKKPYIIIDGAHNEAAAYELERSIREYFKDAKFIGVAGVLKDKDYPKVLKIMMPHMDQLITLTPPDNPRALPAMELAEEAMKYTNRITVADSVEEAYEIAGLLSGGKEDILAFGSLSWLGRFKAEAGKKEN